MNKCCMNHTTNFCPECGTKLLGSPLVGLLKHVESNVVRLCDELANLDDSYDEKYKQRLRDRAVRWEEWGIALRDVLEKQEAYDESN